MSKFFHGLSRVSSWEYRAFQLLASVDGTSGYATAIRAVVDNPSPEGLKTLLEELRANAPVDPAGMEEVIGRAAYEHIVNFNN